MHSHASPRLRVLLCVALAATLTTAPTLLAATPGADVKVTDDNGNVDGGLASVTPSKDAQNRQANEPTIAISPADSPATGNAGDIIAAAANDYRMVPQFLDVWMPVYLSLDGGATWFGAPPFPNGFNTMVPGFPTDTSPAGTSSPLKNLDASGDPVVRFDAAGNLYVAGIAFNRNFDQPDRPVDNLVYVTKYTFTPGTPATASTTTTAGSPPHFTYAGTTVVDRGAVGFAVPHQRFGFAGKFTDKEWLEVDTTPTSPCFGNVYVGFTAFHGVNGNYPIKFSRSSNGGATFSRPITISTGGKSGTTRNQGADIAVAADGTIYVAYATFAIGADTSSISVTKSRDCGRHWSAPVRAAAIVQGQAPGVAFRTPTFAFIAVDDLAPGTVYVAYQNLAGGDYDIDVQRSTNGGATWSAPVQVNDDPGARQQVFPTIEVSHGALHVAWYDFRNSATPGNEALDVFYACTNCEGLSWPNFLTPNVRVTDVSHQGNCLLFGGGTVAFHGDYIELDARWTGSAHTVHVVWADNRDVSDVGACTTAPFPADNTGHRNQNIYADTLTVNP